MDHSLEQLRKLKVDCLYGKKKHFNAADRLDRYRFWIGICLILINLFLGSTLCYVLAEDISTSFNIISIFLSFVAAFLAGLQTFLNLPKRIEGHRSVATKYLACMKECNRYDSYFADNAVAEEDIISKIEEIAQKIEETNNEASHFSTSSSDYDKAKKSIESGEENYTETELNI